MWHQALGELQLQMTKAAFDTWVKQTRALGYRNTTLIIGVQNGYVRDWLKNRLKGVILRTVKGMASGEKIRDIDCVVAGNSSPQAGNGRS
jgi:chromosomal replication initiator protein